MAAAAPMRDNYMFNQEPKPVKNRNRYRQDPREVPGVGHNLMHDPRVMRGSTYAPRLRNPPPGPTAPSRAKQPRTPRSSSAAASTAMSIPRVPTPEPVPGRHHMTVQTDNYLEDLRDKVNENDFATQTDAEMDRPEPALFEPQSSGLDMYTWIDEGDLFDFDLEVEPVLNVLRSRGLEQSLMEVLEEEELKEMSQHRTSAIQLRNAKFSELQRLRAKDERFEAEKERRIEQAKVKVLQDAEAQMVIDAKSKAKDFISSCQEDIIAKLATSGYFYDPVLKQVQSTFLPWLVQSVGNNLKTYGDGRNSVHTILNRAAGLGLGSSRVKLHSFLETLKQRQQARETRFKDIEAGRAEPNENAEPGGPNYSSLGVLGMGVEYGQLDSVWRGAGRSDKLLDDLCEEQKAAELKRRAEEDRRVAAELKRLEDVRLAAEAVAAEAKANEPPIPDDDDDADPDDDDKEPFDDELDDNDDDAAVLGKLTARIGVRVQSHSKGGVRVDYATSDGAASQASVVIGDVIMEVDGKPTPSVSDFRLIESECKVGSVVTMKVLRAVDDREEVVNVELFAKNKAYPPAKVRGMRTALGMPVHAEELITKADAQGFVASATASLGFVAADGAVTAVAAGSSAWRAGLVNDDVVSSVNGVAFGNGQAFDKGVPEDIKAGDKVKVEFKRGDKDMDVELEVGAAGQTVERIRSWRVIARIDKGGGLDSDGSASSPVVPEEDSAAAKEKLDNLEADLGFTSVEWVGDEEGVTAGCKVNRMRKGGAAMHSGLGWGDIVYNINDEAVPTPAALEAMVKTFRAGDVLKMWVVRGTSMQKDLISLEVGSSAADVTLADIRALRSSAGEPVNTTTLHTQESALAALQKLLPRVGFRINDEEDKGVVVTQVHENGQAQKANVQNGDKVEKVGDVEIKSSADFVAAVKTYTAGSKMEIAMGGGKVVVLELGAQVEGEEKENPIEFVRSLRCLAGEPVGLEADTAKYPLFE
mmetsp:Transcript_17809/g.25044  ORF Transcript_17809/g.25044 Transcript_17809/m.25044 type:complete len:982 (-) Transcript_17809:254-3199(-)